MPSTIAYRQMTTERLRRKEICTRCRKRSVKGTNRTTCQHCRTECAAGVKKRRAEVSLSRYVGGESAGTGPYTLSPQLIKEM